MRSPGQAEAVAQQDQQQREEREADTPEDPAGGRRTAQGRAQERRPPRRSCGLGPSSSWSRLMTWTSRSPEPHHPVDDRARARAHPTAPVGGAPSTICVACSARANVDQRRGHLVAHDLVVGAAEVGRAGALAVETFGRCARPGRRSARTWTPTSSPRARPAIRPARRISRSPLGAPVTPRRPARGSPTSGRCRARPGSPAATSSTRSATHSSASSRSAVRLPTRK
jgi:hypothetical protein